MNDHTGARNELGDILASVEDRNPHQPEFLQAVREMGASVAAWYLEQADLVEARIFERLTEPDRAIQFRVVWENDDGQLEVNRGWRIQFCQALGPYKGGLRFSGSVNESVLKFLSFEQTFKNALTGLPMGGAKGGSDFDPKGRSTGEITRFCHAFMTELFHHIGPDKDIPAGDIGVGPEEISAMFGHYLKLTRTWNGALTGKGCRFGGSAERTEATGYGCVYFCEEMLGHHDKSLEDKRIAISGSGNVALHAAQKACSEGAKVVTMSDSGGFIFTGDGLSKELLDELHEAKTVQKKRLEEFAADRKDLEFHDGDAPWSAECDIAMPCATQNELDDDAARKLVDNGVIAVCEGANMPVTADAADVFREHHILHAPGKASNAGGVAVSGMEISQNALRQSWSFEEVDEKLTRVMANIHRQCVEAGPSGGDRVDYVRGANLASFQKVAKTLASFGRF